MEPFFSGLIALSDPNLLLLLVAATLGGVLIGALPGLNATTGAALLLPFTLTMEPIAAIAILTAIYCSATFAGAITAILINTPGTSASATTCLDGYPLAQRGEAGRALGLAVVASTFGGVFSVVCLMLAAPLLARAAYNFAPPEYFALTVFGLSMLATIGDGSPIKNLIAGAFGVLLATVGIDLLTSVERFTFGASELSEGIGFRPGHDRRLRDIGASGPGIVGSRGPRAGDDEGDPPPESCRLRQGVANNSALIGHRHLHRSSSGRRRHGGVDDRLQRSQAVVEDSGRVRQGGDRRNRRIGSCQQFGHRRGDGADACARNPGQPDGSGDPGRPLGPRIAPGPTMFTDQANFAFAIFWSMMLVNILFLAVGLYGAKLFARVTLIPVQILWPCVFIFSIVGAYALDQSMLDVWIALIAGVVGFFMRRYGFSVVPLAIGLILGGMLEQRLGQSMVMLDEKWWLIFTRPLSLFFLLLTALALFGPPLWSRLFRQRAPLASSGE